MLSIKAKSTCALRQLILVALLVFYLIPLFALTFFTSAILPLSTRWSLLTLGFVCATTGAFCLYFLLLHWEKAQATKPLHPIHKQTGPPSSEKQIESQEVKELQKQLAETQKQRESLGSAMLSQEKNVQTLEREKQQLSQHVAELAKEAHLKDKEQGQLLKDKETLLEEYQRTISDQREVLEKKTAQIEELQTQVKDLRYELKTVLSCTNSESLTESSPKPPPAKSRPEKPEPEELYLDLGLLAAPSKSRSEAQIQLKRCIDIAQKLTGARHLAGDSSRFRDLSADGYALDLRRLCDTLRSEQSSMIILYHQRERRLLFANNQVRGLLGWSPEKFVQNFANLLARGQRELASALKKVGAHGQSEASIVLRTRDGDELCLHCLLGVIPTGIFKGHIIGILYPVKFTN